MLRRMIVLVAIITAVPVMLWTITAFMRTYVAQPTIPAARPLAVALAAPVRVGPDMASGAPPKIAPIVEARATTTDARLSDLDPNPPGAKDAKDDAAAPSATASITPRPVTDPQPAAVPAAAVVTPAAAIMPAAAATPWPAPSPPPPAAATRADALPPPDPIVGPVPLPPRRPKILAFVTGQLPPAPPAVAAAVTVETALPASGPPAADQPPQPGTDAADALPPDPLVGPVPLPRHRPNVVALVDGAVPVPRVRPATIAVEPAEPNRDSDPAPGYDPGMTHY